MLLNADNLSKTYHLGKASIEVLRNARLVVEEGESVAIVGASGAGKSTLLHVLGGLDRPDSGDVTVAGNDVYGMNPARRTRLRATDIGFVFQSYHLMPEMDLLENVVLPAMALPDWLHGAGRANARARELLGAVGLADRASHLPMELSGGEQQRAALARALMNEPRLVLADEPTGNLDDATGDLVLELLLSLTRGEGHALVMVTHNHRVAERCDRVLQLTEGGIHPID
ncbi:MAG: ABC transporter ATP-binding protein [Kiritimatiellae bacterium]|nr:ABC transporter ATP-binding protein [Kiritimatiellia bacterium]